jgi:hypothetical protein
MGWKATTYITREEAILLIAKYILTCPNDKLEDLLPFLGYGDNINLPYFGFNFQIKENEK